MAADKKTLLRDALKQVQAGKIEKAAETYKAIIKIDPRDASARNALGDLSIKQGKRKEAIAEYLEVAALYEKDGFGLRAIAICQKVINLDPESIAVRIKLGDLYAGQKLPAEGRAQYLLVANHYDKKGDVANALDIFHRIANLDPDNLPVRVKLAGMFEKQKFPEKAAEEYVRAAQGYADKKDMNAAVQLFVRAFKLFPANTVARRRLADFYAQRQDWSVVVGLLETPVAKGLQDSDLLVLYAEALTRVNHPQDAVNVLEAAQEREPNSVPVNLGLGRAYIKAGETEKGTAAMNRCVSAHLAENRLEPAESLLREMAESAPEDDKIFQRILEVAQKRGDKASVSKAYLKLAEVYEKKKLVRSARGEIEKYLEINPGDPGAVRFLERLQAQAPAPIVEVAPSPSVVSAPPAPPPREQDDVVEINLEDDGLVSAAGVVAEEELFIEVEGEEVEALSSEPVTVADALAIIRHGAPQRGAEFLEELLGGDPGNVEAWQALIEARGLLGDSRGVRDGLLRLAGQHRSAGRFEEARAAYRGALDADPRSAAAARGIADLLVEDVAAEPPLVAVPGSEEEIIIDLSDQEIGEPAGEPQPVPELEPPPEPTLVPEPELVLEPELELAPEIELELAPEIELELAPEIELELAPELETVPIPEAGTAPEPEPGPVFPHAPGPEPAFDGAPVAASVPPLASAAPGEIGTPAGTGVDELEGFLAEADFYFQQGLVDEAEFIYTKLLKLAPGHPVVTRQLRKLEEQRALSPAVPEAAADVKPGEEPDAAPAPAFAAEVSDFSDFISELGQELGAPPIPEPLASPPPLGEEGLSEIFQEFQRSVKEQLGDEDFETHYNLGIAYKEMGLMEEGIAEFTLAEKSPTRRLNAVSMIALCLREMGRFDEAALRLRTGISLAVEGSEDQKGFLYDLATLHEQAGRATDAQEALRRLLDIDPGYRDVAARVGAAPPAAGSASRKKSRVSYL